MSDGKKTNSIIKNVKDAALLKDAALVLGWIAGFMLIAGLCWYFTQPVRNQNLLRAVNRVLEEKGDNRRLTEPILKTQEGMSSGFAGIGLWFKVTELPGRQQGGSSAASASGGLFAVVFTFIGEGGFFPCAAILSSTGEVREFIPLSNYGKKMLMRVSPGILRIYSERIQSARIRGVLP